MKYQDLPPFFTMALGYPRELTLGVVLLLVALAAKIVSFEGFTPARSREKR